MWTAEWTVLCLFIIFTRLCVCMCVFDGWDHQENLRSCSTGTSRKTYSAKCFEGLFRDKGSIKAKEKDWCIGEHSSQDDEVVHVWTRHFYQPDKRKRYHSYRTDSVAIPSTNISTVYTVAKARGGEKNLSPDLLHYPLPETVPNAYLTYVLGAVSPSLKDPRQLSTPSCWFSCPLVKFTHHFSRDSL